jgi:CheY-specific phosphatase CheX
MDVKAVFTEKLMMHTERYISQLGIPFMERYIGTSNTSLAEHYTVKLNISGDIKGSFIFNIETSLAYSLVSHYILEAVNETEIPNYADKVIAEIANIIAGKILNDEEEIDLFLGCPAVFLSSEFPLKVKQNEMLIRGALTESGIIQCMFIEE